MNKTQRTNSVFNSSCNSGLDGNWWVEDTAGIRIFGVKICEYSILIQSGLGVKVNVLVIRPISYKPYS